MHALLTLGRLFGDALKRDPSLLDWAGRFSGALLVLGIVGFFIVRIVRRRMVLKNLVAARLEPEDLKRQLDAGEPVYIVDLRHPLELLPDPFTLPGALHFSPDSLAARHHEIPRDRDIVLFCTCPSEATAAKTAMTLIKLGIERVRPLRGGYDEWKRLGFPSTQSNARPPLEPATNPCLFSSPTKNAGCPSHYAVSRGMGGSHKAHKRTLSVATPLGADAHTIGAHCTAGLL